MKKTLFVAPAVAYLLYRLNAKTSTKKNEGENAISELKMVPVNDTELAVMIAGTDKDNPVLLCVTGGPAGSEIPFIRRHEKELEKHFTIVHYDQRGAGKSYSFKEDYKDINYHQHVADLIALTEYVREYLNKDKVYLMGHSYGTYLGTLAANEKPEYYKAYIGVGQMSDMAKAESYTLEDCIRDAKEKGNEKDVKLLESLREKVKNGETIAPRKYVRKYGYAEHEEQHEMRYVISKLLTGPEYNLMDGFKFFYAMFRYSMPLALQSLRDPLPSLVSEVKIPTYFVLGKYDGQTNTRAAKEYFDSLTGDAKKEFVIFENSAHSPQIEESEKFADWMCNVMLKENEQ
ncbi:MAG: alpha/beta hydrolase [Erysipelotrichaceae bacterium]|nr:alpha/beta hydrolase [Erysipelotrichaceae bacterium]